MEKHPLDTGAEIAIACATSIASAFGWRQSDPLPVGKRAVAAAVRFLRAHPDAAPEAIYRQLHDDGVMPADSDRNAWVDAPVYLRAFFTALKAMLSAGDEFLRREQDALAARDRAKKAQITSVTKLSAGKTPRKRTVLERVGSVGARLLRVGRPSPVVRGKDFVPGEQITLAERIQRDAKKEDATNG